MVSDMDAGCVLASRLSSARLEEKILVIEAGKRYDERVKPSMGVALSGGGKDLMWGGQSIAQEALEGRTVCLFFFYFQFLFVMRNGTIFIVFRRVADRRCRLAFRRGRSWVVLLRLTSNAGLGELPLICEFFFPSTGLLTNCDSDRWAQEVGDERWSWKGLLPYFKKSETWVPGKEMPQEKCHDIHGYEGPITVSTPLTSP